MMMKIEFECDNAAFGEDDSDCAAECARILKSLACEIRQRGTPMASGLCSHMVLMDINGNQVGTCWVE